MAVKLGDLGRKPLLVQQVWDVGSGVPVEATEIREIMETSDVTDTTIKYDIQQIRFGNVWICRYSLMRLG